MNLQQQIMVLRKNNRPAKILEIGPYPPPRAGWALRIQFVRQRIEGMGHRCPVLNIGKNRKIPDSQYTTVRNALDYVMKVTWYSLRGYRIHMHTNGDVWPTGWALTLLAEVIGMLTAKRAVLTFHAGTHQVYFPRERSGKFIPVLYLMFALSKRIICNNAAVKEKIVEYGIAPEKIHPISAFSRQYVEIEETNLPDRIDAFLQRHDPVIFTYVFLRDGYYIDAMIDGLRQVREQWPGMGVVNVGSLDDSDPVVRKATERRLDEAGLAQHFFSAGDLTHDEFLTLLCRCDVYLRTPTTDGDSASVLEALSFGVPVVAAENGNRPASVITYRCDDAGDMSCRIGEVLSDRETASRNVIQPEIRDTVGEEADLLVSCALRSKSGSQPACESTDPARSASSLRCSEG